MTGTLLAKTTAGRYNYISFEKTGGKQYVVHYHTCR